MGTRKKNLYAIITNSGRSVGPSYNSLREAKKACRRLVGIRRLFYCWNGNFAEVYDNRKAMDIKSCLWLEKYRHDIGGTLKIKKYAFDPTTEMRYAMRLLE